MKPVRKLYILSLIARVVVGIIPHQVSSRRKLQPVQPFCSCGKIYPAHAMILDKPLAKLNVIGVELMQEQFPDLLHPLPPANQSARAPLFLYIRAYIST
jgi:hypothetical protein